MDLFHPDIQDNGFYNNMLLLVGMISIDIIFSL